MDKNTQNCDLTGKRTLKIYSKYLTRFNGFFIAPEIRLCGKWLLKLGFQKGENIIINYEQDRILIVKSNKKIIKL